jgi:hypothetical protein
MNKFKAQIILGFIFYLSIIALGHLFHGSVDALKRLHLTRALITEGSIFTEKYGAVEHAPLQSFAMIPQYGLGYILGKTLNYSDKKSFRIAYRFCVYFFTPVLMAVICVLYFNFLGRLGFELPIKLFSTYILLFGTILLPFSKWLWSEPLSALLLFSSLYCLFRSFKGDFRKFNRLNFLFLGLLTLNAHVYYVYYVLMFVYVLYYFHVLKNNPENKKILIVDASIIITFSLLLYIYYNYARYGTLMPQIAPEGRSPDRFSGTFDRPLIEGIYSLLFSIGKGVTIYSPWTFLCPFVFVFFCQKFEENTRYLFATLLISYWVYLIIFGKFSLDLWTWGPRYLVPFVPAIHLLFPFLVKYSLGANRLAQGFLILIGVWAIGINGFEFMGGWQHYQHISFIETGVPYSQSVYTPQFSPLYNNWETSPNPMSRLLQFWAITGLSFYVVMEWYRKKYPNA